MTDPSKDEGRGRVVVVGAGLSGMATALGAALRGRSVTVFESAELVGGASAYSGGQVWVGANHVAEREGIEDSLDLVERYVLAIAHDHPEVLDVAAMKRWITAAPVAARYWEEVERSAGRSRDSPTTTRRPLEHCRSEGISRTRCSTEIHWGSGGDCSARAPTSRLGSPTTRCSSRAGA